MFTLIWCTQLWSKELVAALRHVLDMYSRLTTGSVTARFQHSSDCNSNRSSPPAATSTTSIDSSVHDTGEYHWCEENGEERGFKEGSSSTTSLATSAPKAPPAAEPHQLEEYVALAKTVDANLAHIDMEDFRSEDMHSLLIPPLCPSSQVGKDGSYSDPSSQGESSLTDMEMSLCKSGPLFSPVREAQEIVPTRHVTTISTDSLNSENEEDLVLAVTCKANMTNYTLAFEGSALMSSASATDPSLDSDYHEQGSREGSSSSESANWLEGYHPPPIPPMPKHQYGTWPHQRRQPQLAPTSVAMRTPWSPTVIQSAQNTPVKRRTRHSNPIMDRRQRESDLTNGNDDNAKCQSLPDLYKKCLNNALPRGKDTTHGAESSTSSDSSTSSGNKNSHPERHNETLTLLQIYMRQKSGTELNFGETRHKKPQFVHTDRLHSNLTDDLPLTKNQTCLEDSLLTPPYYDMIASGGGEAWVEDYPSSADEKVGDESSILSSFNNKPALHSTASHHHHTNNMQRSLPKPEQTLEESLDQTEISEEFPLTETSDFNGSLNIDALPFNKEDKLRVLVSDSMSQCSTRSRQSHTFSHTANSIDKVIAKIRPFELGLLPGSFEEKLHAKIQATEKSSHGELTTIPKIAKSDEAVQTASTSTNSEATQTSPKKTVDQQTDSRDLLLHQRAAAAAAAAAASQDKPSEPTVYVVFPSYSLPDLSFLNKADSFQPNVVISPQPARPVSVAHPKPARSRPLSCTDVEKLRSKDFKHIQDWDSLNFLLPPDMKEILSDIPETEPLTSPTATTDNRRRIGDKTPRNFGRTRPKSCDAATLTRERSKSSTSSSKSSSGYRGSSGMCSTASSPLFSSPSSFFSSPSAQLPPLPQSPNGSPNSPPPPYEQRSEAPPPLPRRSASLQGCQYTPPRPPLPKGILRKTVSEQERQVRNLQRHHRLSLPVAPPPVAFDADLLAQTLSATAKDLARLEEQLQLMGLSLCNETLQSPKDVTLAQGYGNPTPQAPLVHENPAAATNRSISPQDKMHPLRKTVSFGDKMSLNLNNRWASVRVPDSLGKSLNMEQKQELVQSVSVSAAQLCRHLHLEQAISPDKKMSPSRLVSTALSPALYNLVSDGLKPCVSTLFGQVPNSVWKVIEAAVKLGPTLPWLDELVFCLANEDSLPDGPLRFTAFITELLNMGALNWWLENLTAKEAVLRRHYQSDSFLFNCNTLTRPLTQELLAALTPIAALPYDYHLDINPSPLQSPIHGPGEFCPTVMEAMGLTAERKKASPTSQSPSSSTASSAASLGSKEPKALASPSRLPSRRNARPLSCVESPRSATKKVNYKRTVSQPGSGNDKNAQEMNDGQGFSTIRYQWEMRCNDHVEKKSSPASSNVAQQPKNKSQPSPAKTLRKPDKSRIPRPVSCTTPIKH